MTRKGKEAAGSSSKAPARKVQNPGCIKERLFKVEDFEGVPDLLIPDVAFMTVLLSFGWRKFISDLPCDKSFGLRTVQLRSKRGRVELEDNQDEERPEGSSSAPPVVGRNPFERQILERLQKIEDTQGVILTNQDKTAKAFAKLFRHLNLPDDDE
ncbi:hypothetical protein OROGR_025547 [Orobanche gracilis]